MNPGRLARGSLLAWFAANPVAANLLMLLIFLGGGISLQTIDKQAYPRFAPTEIEISAEYPGAAPADIEAGVCIPIEEAVHDLPGIKRLKSNATAGKCEIAVIVQQDYDLKTLSADLRARTQSIKNLPKAVERINIDDMGWEYPAISVLIFGDTDRMTLRHLAERAQEDLGRLPEVRLTKLWNKMDFEIAIEISAERLRQHQLSLDEVIAAIRKSSLDIPGGVVKADTGQFQLHAVHTAYDRDALLAVTIRTQADGTHMTLGDIAKVTEGFADNQFEYRSNGKPSETVAVYAQHDLVATAQSVTDYVATLQATMPEGITVTTRRDNARSFSELLDTLVFEGISGFILVLGVLMVFLSTQVALWAAVGILISVFGALWLMPLAGATLNMLSLFGFVLAMGVLVDDAIIVSERIHELQSQGKPGLRGAVAGVRDVATPVILGVSIGLIAFLPGLFVPPSWALGFMKPVAVVMILSLAFSLVEALLILPAHLAHESQQASRHDGGASGQLARLRLFLNGGLDWLLRQAYQPMLKQVIAWRYAALTVFAGALIMGWALIHADYVKISLEEDVGYDNFHVHLWPPLGTPYADSYVKVQEFVAALDKAEAELNAQQPPGSPPIVEGLDLVINATDPQVWVEFSSEARRQFHIRDLIKLWYKHIGDMGDFRPDFHTPTEQDVVDLEVEISAADPKILDLAATAIKHKIATYPGVVEVEDSRRPGTPEIRMHLTPLAESLGLRLLDIAGQVQQAYFGGEVQRFIRNREEIKIMVRYPEAERHSVQDLKAAPISLPDGSQVDLGSVVDISYVPGFGALTREDRRSSTSIHVRLDESAPIKGKEIFKELDVGFFPDLENSHESLEISAGEASEEADLIMDGLKRNTLFALVAIYAIIAVSFRSYLQPLLFMLAVPIAWLGAVLIHWATGITMSFQSIVGMVAASGVVVNDSIVLLDYIQKRRADDHSAAEIIMEACASRFRPIILVSLTNLAGFFPMLFETSEQAKFLVPMTLSLTFGLLFGMASTLVLTPVCYAVLDDLTVISGKLRNWLGKPLVRQTDKH